MKLFKTIYIGLIIILISFVYDAKAQNQWISFRDDDGMANSKPKVDLLCSTVSSIMISVHNDGMQANDISADNEIYQQLNILNGGHTAEVGAPELPTVGRFLEIPYIAKPKITIVSSKFKEIEKFNIFPAQEPMPDIYQGNQKI